MNSKKKTKQKTKKQQQQQQQQQRKFGTKNWIDINDQSRGVYNTNCDIRFKTTILKFRVCDYSYAYLLKEE